MKKVDIRKILVCEILKQTGVTKVEDDNVVLGHDPYYVWDYENQDTKQFGLFVRTLGGYKHILTDTIYPKPSKRTGNRYVINPDTIDELVKYERAYCSYLINKNQSYYIEKYAIQYLEERVNSVANFVDEDEEELEQ